MIRAVAFDFDGTLVCSDTVKRDAYARVFAEYGPEAATLAADIAAQTASTDRYGVIRAILMALGDRGLINGDPSDGLVGRYAGLYNAICEEEAATCAEVRGASGVLAKLANRLPLYVNSGTPDGPLHRIVQRRGWSGYFEGIFGSSASKVENLERVARREYIAPSAVLFVGDSTVDWEVARVVGSLFVGIQSPTGELVVDSGFPLLTGLEELPKIATGGNGGRRTAYGAPK